MRRLIIGLLFIPLLHACEKSEDTSQEASEAAAEQAATGGEKGASADDAPPKGQKPVPQKLPKSAFETIQWTDLIPEEDLNAILNPPEYLNEIQDGSEEDQLAGQFKSNVSQAEDRYQQALVSKDIRPEFNGRNVRIPGFIVPLEFDDEQTITTFFLVPFFGACIHQPPPPPNQILYAEYEPGIRLDALYDPFWIDGTISTTLVENDLATAAYSITVSAIEPYVEDIIEENEPPL